MAAKRILIVAGEASGDVHAAKLVWDVLQKDPTIKFFGMGGANMRQAGVDTIININKMSTIGVVDAMLNLPRILSTMRQLRKLLKTDPPAMIILVDYPSFNLPLARIAKKLGVKTFYYISPKLWASRAWRIKTIRKYVDQMAVIFPFEVDYYKKLNYPVTFVGNPLTETVKPTISVKKAKQEFSLDPNRKTVGLFPGSRKGEIKRLLPVILQTAKLLKQQFKDIQFIMPLASSLTRADLGEVADLNIKVIANKTYGVMQVCDAAIAVSGTVTLESALMQLPIVIIYKIFPPYFPIHWVISIPYIGLCNIVAGKRIVQELLQQHANPKEISAEISKILTNVNYRNNMIAAMEKIKAKLIADKSDLTDMILRFC